MSGGNIAARNPLVARLLILLVRRRVALLKRLVEIVLGGDIFCELPSTVVFPHPYGITIHRNAVIGSHVVIMQQVTIGANFGDDVAPVIEDFVLVGAGAKIIGGVRVGRGARVGANAVVSRDVPAECTVVGWNEVLTPEKGGA